jgi:predicted PurR-regulated permease PerM
VSGSPERPRPTDGATAASSTGAGAWQGQFPPARLSAPGLITAAGVAGTIVLLWVVRDTLPVFVVGLLFAYLLSPLVRWMTGHRVPRGLATLIAMILLGLAIAAFTILFLDTIVNQAAAFAASLPAALSQIGDWIIGLGLPAAVEEDILDFLASVESAAASFDYASLLGPLLSGLLGLLGTLFSLLVLPFFLFFVLAGAPTIYRSIQGVLPPPWRGDVLVSLHILLDSFATYIKAEMIVASIVGAMAWVGLMLLSVTVDERFADVALVLALIAALSEFIPNLGPWIAAIPAILFALTISPLAVAATAVLYLVVMFVEGQVLVPKIEGGAFSFHPALVLFLVMAGIALLGILGAILVLPVTATAWRTMRYAFRRSSGQLGPPPPDGPFDDEWPPHDDAITEPVPAPAAS